MWGKIVQLVTPFLGVTWKSPFHHRTRELNNPLFLIFFSEISHITPSLSLVFFFPTPRHPRKNRSPRWCGHPHAPRGVLDAWAHPEAELWSPKPKELSIFDEVKPSNWSIKWSIPIDRVGLRTPFCSIKWAPTTKWVCTQCTPQLLVST